MASTNSLTQQLSRSLVEDAKSLALLGQFSHALAHCFQAMVLCPGNSSYLRHAGDIYARMGNTEESVLCYRGVVPEEAEQRYFHSEYARCVSHHEAIPEEAGRSSLLGAVLRRMPTQTNTPTVDNGVTHRPAYSADSIPLTSPVQFPPDKQYPQFHRSTTESSDTFTSVIDEGEVWFDGLNILVRNQNREVVTEHNKGNVCVALAAATIQEPIHLNGTACFLDARSSHIYYHWMIDVLPKLRILERTGFDIINIDHYIVRAHSSFQLDTLANYGIDPEKIVVTDGVQFFNANTMVIPFLKNDLGKRIYTGLGIGIPGWVPDYLSRSFIASNDESAESTPNRIYISRSTRGTRSVDNESEFIRLLEQRQFTAVNLENFPVGEQAALLNKASIVVGSHGAGLTNIVFCQPGTKVVEIFSEYMVPCYWSLASLKSLSYHQYFAAHRSEHQNTARTVSSDRDRSLQIDFEEFFNWFDATVDTKKTLVCHKPVSKSRTTHE